jgi:hypothetical protein
VGIPTLHAIFEEKYYTHLEGGILESFGKLFRNNVKLYIHPDAIPPPVIGSPPKTSKWRLICAISTPICWKTTPSNPCKASTKPTWALPLPRF